jgi:hypothetical protein
LSSQKLKIIEEKSTYFVTINLIADELIDYEGEHLQVYRIERKKEVKQCKMNQIYYFGLSARYNKIWQDLALFTEGDQLCVGFKKKGKLIKLYRIYSYKYYNEKFGSGDIIIETFSNKGYKTI